VPVLTIFAGPNGSGKSSFIRRVEFEGRETCWKRMPLQGASSRNFRNKPASQLEGKFFAGLASTFAAGRALLSKPPGPETGRILL
jgi:hypothetical protein